MNLKSKYFLLVVLLFAKILNSQTITTTPAITHVACFGNTTGSIQLNNTTGGTSPYTYTWQTSPRAVFSNSISGRGIGNYSVTIQGTGTLTNSYNYNIGYKVLWQDFYFGMMTNSSGDTLMQKRSDGLSTWLETANSANILSGSTDGWVEYVVTTTAHNKIFGLLDSASGTGYANIDFGIIFNAGGTMKTINNGAQTSIGTYAVGDVIRIERVSNNMTYRKNNLSVWTTTIATSMVQSRLTIRAALYTYNSKMENLGCSFTSENISAGTSKTITCTAPTATLVGSTNVIGGTYTWTPGGSAANSLTTTVTSANTYSLKIMVPQFGCSATSTVAVISNTTSPNVSAGSNKTITCTSPTVTLNGSSTTSGATFSWTPGGITTATMNVTANGTYTLKVTDPVNGCSATSTVAVTTNTALPNVSAGSNKTITCANPTVTLNGSSSTSGATFSWAPGGITSATMNVTADGTYTLKVTDPVNGCLATSTVAVTTNTALPNVSAGANKTITCTSPTVTLNGSSTTSGATFSWTPGGITTATMNVTANGTYTLKVTDPVNGCFATSTVAVTTNTTLPNVSAGSNKTITCASPTVTLNGSSSTSGATFSWTPGGITTATMNVTANGIYTLNVTDPVNGCSATSTVAVTTNTTLPAANAGTSQIITSATPTVTLNGSSSTPGATFSWTPGGITTATMNVTADGIYTLIVTDPVNGCSATSTVVVIQINTIPVIIHASPNGMDNGSIVLNNTSGATAPYSYTWQPGNTTGNQITMKPFGNYTVTINDASVITNTLTYDIGYKTNWRNYYGTAFRNDTLYSDGSISGNNTAISTNELQENTNGWAEFIVPDFYYPYLIGFLDSAMASYVNTHDDVDFAFHESWGNNLYSWSDGYFSWLGTVKAGDVMKIDRTGSYFNLSKNGSIIHSSSAPTNKKFKIKALLDDQPLANIGCSFRPDFDIATTQVDANCLGPSTGSINIVPSGGNAPYGYLWSNGSRTNSLTSLMSGVYSVTVTDTYSDDITKSFTITTCPSWETDTASVIEIVNNGELRKTSSSTWDNSFIRGIRPFNFSDTARWISFDIADTLSNFIIGFGNAFNDTLETGTPVSYKVQILNRKVIVNESDNDGFVNRLNIANVATNDKIKIYFTSKGICYYINGVCVYTSKLFSEGVLTAEAQIYSSGSSVKNIRISNN